MDKLMNRCRGFAEGVVVMICPVLLALALNKVDLKSEVYGHAVPTAMLVLAGITLITGIFPLLVCYFCQRFLNNNNNNNNNARDHQPASVIATSVLAPFSSIGLLVIASLMARVVVSRPTAITVGVLFGACIVIRMVSYILPGPRGINDGRFHDVLDESHEFLCGVTGILFLGLEGLALEGHNQLVEGNHALGLGEPMGTMSFVVCALGVLLMFIEMTPPQACGTEYRIVGFTLLLDSAMAAGTFAVLVAVMVKLMGPVALVLFLPPVAIFFEFLYQLWILRNDDDVHGSSSSSNNNNNVIKPASLELTRVTFTGFLAVSVTAMGNDDGESTSKLTDSFLLFAAAAIVFGLLWRLLSQIQIRILLETRSGHRPAFFDGIVASSARLASFCAHLCIVVATVLFAAMAGTAGDGSSTGAPPRAGNGTRVSHVIASAQNFAPAYVVAACTSVILLFV